MDTYRHILFAEEDKVEQTTGEVILNELFIPEELYICSNEEDIKTSILNCEAEFKSFPDLIILSYCISQNIAAIFESITSNKFYNPEGTKIILTVYNLPEASPPSNNIFYLKKPLTLSKVKNILS